MRAGFWNTGRYSKVAFGVKAGRRAAMLYGALIAALVVVVSYALFGGEMAVLSDCARRFCGEISGYLNLIPVWAYALAIFILPIFFFPVSLIFMIAGNKAACGECSFWEVYAFCALGLTLNILFTYFLAAFFGSFAERLLAKRGLRVPKVCAGDECEIILLIRMIPGNPLIIQNYILGLARVNYLKYALISVPFQLITLAAYMYFGESVFEGDFAGVSMAVSLIIILALIARIVSKRCSHKAGDV